MNLKSNNDGGELIKGAGICTPGGAILGIYGGVTVLVNNIKPPTLPGQEAQNIYQGDVSMICGAVFLGMAVIFVVIYNAVE